MLDEYEFNQGVVIRQIVAGAHSAVRIAPFEREGRINAFVLDNKVGVFIKHSSKRMSPWPFSFHPDQIADLLDLAAAHHNCFVVFVCGTDGVVTIDMGEFYEIATLEGSETAWVRISRPPRLMYGVSGNRGELANKVARGVSPIVKALTK